jgi:hypothetical protein
MTAQLHLTQPYTCPNYVHQFIGPGGLGYILSYLTQARKNSPVSFNPADQCHSYTHQTDSTAIFNTILHMVGYNHQSDSPTLSPMLRLSALVLMGQTVQP